MHKQRIATRFSAAAERYDEASALQRKAALGLAQRVRSLALPEHPRVLEIGCGTGHLSRALLPSISGDWIVSDLAPPMLHAWRANMASAAACLAMDGERPALRPGSFDLVVSSLAAQWFVDLRQALAGLADLLAPDGRIALVTLGAKTFSEWRNAHSMLGLCAATHEYPDAAAFARAFPSNWQVDVVSELVVTSARCALDFLRGLRLIGADTPRSNARPLSASQLKRVMAALEAEGEVHISYELLYASARRRENMPA